MSRLVQPVLDGEVDVAHGSRVLGHAEPNHYARELGIVFFNRLVSFITRTQGERLLERLPRGAHHRCCRSWCCARSSSTPPSS